MRAAWYGIATMRSTLLKIAHTGAGSHADVPVSWWSGVRRNLEKIFRKSSRLGGMDSCILSLNRFVAGIHDTGACEQGGRRVHGQRVVDGATCLACAAAGLDGWSRVTSLNAVLYGKRRIIPRSGGGIPSLMYNARP